MQRGETIFGFMGSAPPEKTGLHRYTFLLYEQKCKLDLSNVPRIASDAPLEERVLKSTRLLSQEYNLGNPIAGNFYLAKYEG